MARPSSRIKRLQGSDGGSGMIIAAYVRAKLLGLKILSLDARIVLDPSEPGSATPSAFRQSELATSLSLRPAHDPRRREDLALAVRLLEEGVKNLTEVRGGFDGDHAPKIELHD